MRKGLFFGAALLGGVMTMQSNAAHASVKTEVVTYKEGDTVLEGILAWDPAKVGKGKPNRPGVLLIHDWKGVGKEVTRRAIMIAELGYVAFAADIYGKGVRPADAKAAGQEAGKYKGDRPLLRRRVNAGLSRLLEVAGVDPSRVAAIGYCFGGTTVLELARSGASLNGVVSFHGGLDSPTPADARAIKAKVLVLHGAVDPMVPATEVAAFQDEMTKGQVDWSMVSYGGAVHSFTNPEAGNDPSRGAAYQKIADERSWRAMNDFFGEIFAAR